MVENKKEKLRVNAINWGVRGKKNMTASEIHSIIYIVTIINTIISFFFKSSKLDFTYCSFVIYFKNNFNILSG